METTSFRQFLESFCSNSPWNYAVFWKVQQFQDQTLLIYEDGYYDHNVLKLCSRSITRFSGQKDTLNLGIVTDLLGEDVPEWSIGFGSAVISCHQYSLGRGMVGRVAFNGNDLLLYSDEPESMELISSYIENHSDEWLLPDSGGIKTTLITPIFPHGVLQLGSFDKVAENSANVADIKDQIFSVMFMAIHSPLNNDESTHLCSSNPVPDWEIKDEPSFNPFHESLLRSAEEYDTAEFADIEISTGYEIIDSYQLEDFATNSLMTCHMDVSHIYMDLGIDEFHMPDMSEVLENVWAFTSGISGESSSGESSYVLLEKEQQSPDNKNDNGSSHTNPEGSPGQTDPQETTEKTLSFDSSVDSCIGLNGTATRSCGWFDEEGDHDYLLEAAIALLYKNSDDSLACMCNSSKSTVTLLPELDPSFQVQTLYETKDALTEHHTAVSDGKCTSVTHRQSTPFNISLMSPDSDESYGSASLKEDQPVSCENGVSHENKIRKHSKGKARSKSSLRPRPRDRQLIQDRLQQLRQLVPTGTKSSIDGLLEQTTKHMMFLRSVTEQAKKVKQFTDKKIVADKDETNTKCPSRTSLPQQGQNKTESCPIFVTDMEHPGQFLIQMLCNTDEVFFEMIEVMRQLNLSILEGVMEARRNNWARFIVEASEGFNRLDIFWPLMRILQRNGDWMTNMNQWCT